MNPVHMGRAKRIDIKHHYVRDRISNYVIDLKYVATKDNIADVLTKALDVHTYHKFQSQLGIT